MTQTSKERRQLAAENKNFGRRWTDARPEPQHSGTILAENKNFGRRWTDARPEPQHSGTILWVFVALLLCAVTGVMLMVVR